jgi:hypothetical protein
MLGEDKALDDDIWVSQINTQEGLIVGHISQFYKLWGKLQSVHLDHDTDDSVSWKLGKDGFYLASSTYKMQFLGHTSSPMTSMVWRPCDPPNANSSCGLFFKFVFRCRIVFIRGGDQIVAVVSFATKCKYHPRISTFIADSHDAFGKP